MSNQIVISSGAKVRNLQGVLTATTGIVDSVPLGGANGVATLDALGKVPLSQLPASVVTYLGTWNASTNTPTLANGTGDIGDLYICNVAGTVNFGAGPITFAAGDWVIYSGTIWEKSSGASGTVTSVAVTESGDALTITGSPITTSGTINIGFAGTSGQYINGAGGLTTFPSLTGYVPYTGATADVDLGNFGLQADYLNVNVPSTHTPTVGDIVWNSIDGTFDMGLLNGVTLQAGQELHFYGKASGAIGNGQAVMFAGVEGDHLLMSLADAATINANPQYFIGVATQDFANNEFGYVTVLGKVRGLDTTAYTLGEVLYYDSTSATDGLLTGTMPSAPNAKIQVAAVVRVHATQGVLMVRPHAMPRISDLQDVNISSIATNNILAWDTNKWQNNTIAGVLGYTPANDSLVVHLAGTETITGLKTFDSGLQLASEGSGNQSSLFVNISSIFASSGGSNRFGFNNSNNIYFNKGVNNGGILAWNNSSYRTYNLQDADGTLAFTSDLSGYLPLSGGTLTGKLTINTGGIDNQLQLNGTAPSLRLTNAVTGATINGFIAMAGTIGDYILTSAVGDMCIGNQNSGKIIFGFGSGTATAKMTIDSSGNGIFSGTLSATGGTLTGALSGTSATFSGLIQNTDGYQGRWFRIYEASAQRGGFYTYNVISGAGTDYGVGLFSESSLWFAAGGGVTKHLTIASTGAATFSNSVTAGGNIESTGSYFSVGNGYFGKASAIFTSGSANDAGFMVSGSNNLIFGNALTEAMRITSGGEVQINTTTVYGSKLTVNGNIFQIDGTKGIYSNNFGVLNGGGTNLSFEYSSGGSTVWGNGTERLRLTSTGLIISPPTYTNTSGGAASVGVAATGEFYRSTSSLKYKKNVRNYDKGLEIVSQLRPVYYESINESENGIQYAGLIAEEIHDLGLTEFVQYATDGTPDALAYQNMVALAFKAIQEQQAQIEELKALITAK